MGDRGCHKFDSEKSEVQLSDHIKLEMIIRLGLQNLDIQIEVNVSRSKE